MAGHCRGNQLHCRQSSSCCNCICACASSANSQTLVPNFSSGTTCDPVLVALISRLLQSSPPPSQHFLAEEILGFQCQHWEPQKRDLRHKKCQQEEQDQSLIRSLLQRISALESAIPGDSSSPRITLKVSKALPRRAQLRDLAARSIQSAFRRYLIRRSRTLRDLKLLAAVRFHLAVLRSSISGEASVNPMILLRKVADLLRQLESIQSTDAMVLEGKRPIGRELAQYLEFAESLMEAMDQRTLLGNEKGEMVESGESDDGSSNAAKKASGVTAVAPKSIEEQRSRICNGIRLQREGELLFDWVGPEEVMGAVGDESLLSKQRGGKFFNGRRALEMDQDGSSSSGLSAPLPLQMEPRKGHGKRTTVSIS